MKIYAAVFWLLICEIVEICQICWHKSWCIFPRNFGIHMKVWTVLQPTTPQFENMPAWKFQIFCVHLTIQLLIWFMNSSLLRNLKHQICVRKIPCSYETKNSKLCLWNSTIVWNKKRLSYPRVYRTGMLSKCFAKLSAFLDPGLLKSCLYTSISLWSLNFNKFFRKISWPYGTWKLEVFL